MKRALTSALFALLLAAPALALLQIDAEQRNDALFLAALRRITEAEPDHLFVTERFHRLAVCENLAGLAATHAHDRLQQFRAAGAEQAGNSQDFALLQRKRHGGELRRHRQIPDLKHGLGLAGILEHGRLGAFCDKWVPHGADAERRQLLDDLQEVVDGLQLGAADGPAPPLSPLRILADTFGTLRCPRKIPWDPPPPLRILARRREAPTGGPGRLSHAKKKIVQKRCSSYCYIIIYRLNPISFGSLVSLPTGRATLSHAEPRQKW